MSRIPPQSPDDMLARFGKKVERCLQGMLDTMLLSLVPDGQEIEEFRKRYSVTVDREILTNGIFVSICVRGEQVGYLLYEDGVIGSEMELGPFL